MDDNLKVIFYPHIGEYGGIERNIIALAEEVNAMGCKPILLCFYDNVGMGKLANNLCTIELKDHWNPFVKGRRLKKWFKENNRKISGQSLFFGTKASFYAYISGLNNYVLHYTDPPSLLSNAQMQNHILNWVKIPKEKISNWITWQGVKNAKRCITMTFWNAEELRLLYKRTFDVIYQGGVPTNSINLHHCIRPLSTRLRIFSICRITGSKNLDWIIYTVRNLIDDVQINQLFPKIECMIAGEGPKLEELKLKVNELNLQENIFFSGFLNQEQVEDEFCKSNLFLVPAKQGYGLPILEALYRKVPVVINIESRISEVLSNNPWVEISQNGLKSFSEQVIKHIINLNNKFPDEIHLENLPTEKKWAHDIGAYCGWWKH